MALAVNPAAAIAVIAMGIVLSQLLRPLNQRTRRNNRQLSKTTRAMATQVTEYTRLSRDFRLFGVESRVIDKLSGLIKATSIVFRKTAILNSIGPVLYQSFALGFIIVAIAALGRAGHARLADLGACLLYTSRCV